ncbi:MAG: flippase-like domain-containing protein [Chloroflexi bacterium]|nr:flippase-like domain-containing protein [Chloroflexota bacterium]
MSATSSANVFGQQPGLRPPAQMSVPSLLLRLLVGCLVTAMLGFLVLRQVHPYALLNELESVHERWILAALMPVPFAFGAMAWRWTLLLSAGGKLSVWRSAKLLGLSYFINLVLPGRAGDLTRSYLAGMTKDIGFRSALASVIVEKSLDGLTVVLLITLCLRQFPLPAVMSRGIIAAGTMFLGLLVALGVLSLSTGRHPQLLSRFPIPSRLLPSISELLERFAIGSRSLTRPDRLLRIIALTLLTWSLALVTTYCLVQAFSLQLPSLAPALALGVASLGLTIPAAPGGVGAYQGLVMVVLERYGVPSAQALGFGLALQFCQVLPLVLFGIVVLPSELVALRQVFTMHPGPGSQEQLDVSTPEGEVVEQL